jgi:hypothetical protein
MGIKSIVVRAENKKGYEKYYKYLEGISEEIEKI